MNLRKTLGEMVGGESESEKARKADIEMNLSRIDVAIKTEEARHAKTMKGLVQRQQELKDLL